MESSGLIYLVRHCSTSNDECNYPKLLGRGMIVGLSQRGQEQAAQLAEYFATLEIAAIYASPLARAVQTARRIKAGLDVPMTFCTSLTEADVGEWQGQSWDELLHDDAERYDAFMHDPGAYGFPGGETINDVCRRAVNFIEKLAEQHPTDRIVLVSHEYLNRAVLAHYCGVPFNRMREIDQDPGCVNLLRTFRGVVSLHAVNQTECLEFVDDESDITTETGSL